MSLQKFATRYNLHMDVTERDRPKGSPDRYYASFRNVEVKDGCILSSPYGNGAMPAKAIADYAPQLSNKIIVIDAMRESRREVTTPVVTP